MYFILLGNFGKILYDLSKKYIGTLELAEFRKMEKLSRKIKKAELNISL